MNKILVIVLIALMLKMAGIISLTLFIGFMVYLLGYLSGSTMTVVAFAKVKAKELGIGLNDVLNEIKEDLKKVSRKK